jgi:hypothetical protein
MSRLLLLGGALVAAVSLPASASAAQVKLTATLTGANETAGGDADGSGTFTAEADPVTGDFCYTLTGKDIDAPTAAHVHTGVAGKDGPPVISLHVVENECLTPGADVVKPIVANPSAYYVNIHTAAYPKGALRGQLRKQ